MPRQEPGLRPARPLPYRLHVHGRTDAASGRYWLDFVNEGSAGAGLNVLSQNRNDGPWYYLLEGGRNLSDYWSAVSVTAGLYDLHVYGPNGFLRSFAGNLSAAVAAGGANPEIKLVYDAPNRILTLQLSNSGSAACTLTLHANHYSTAPASSFVLAAGASMQLPWPVGASGNWYDFSLTSDSDPHYLRRCAGHLEDGNPSISDPAFGAADDRIFADQFDFAPVPGRVAVAIAE